MQHIHARNERNGSLIDESEMASEDPLEKVRNILTNAYSDPTRSSNSIGALVAQVVEAHSADLGHFAEFWLLLAVGEVFAHPRLMHSHKAGVYRVNARQCADITTALVSDHIELIGKITPVRFDYSDFKARIAVKLAKAPFKQLKNELMLAA